MQDGAAKVDVRLFKVLLSTYVYDDTLGTFVLLSDLPSGLPMQLHLATEALQAIEQGTFANRAEACVCCHNSKDLHRHHHNHSHHETVSSLCY